METNVLSPEKSFQIINDAIEKSRKDFEKDAGSPMILWGAVVLAFSIAVYSMLKLTGNLSWNFLWFGIPVLGWPLSIDCSTLNVPPISLSNVPGISE